MDEVEYLDTTLVLGCNLYTYCVNNPIVNIDIYGTTHLNTGKSCTSVYTIEDTNGVYRHRMSKNSISHIVGNPRKVIVQYDGELFVFDFSENPNYNFFTSFYYTNELNKMGLPNDRTYLGIWLELYFHYVVHEIDVFDRIENDNKADMGNFKRDKNAWFFEYCIYILIGNGGLICAKFEN